MVSEDLSYSLADMLYGVLLEKPLEDGASLPELSKPDSYHQPPTNGSHTNSSHKNGSGSGVLTGVRPSDGTASSSSPEGASLAEQGSQGLQPDSSKTNPPSSSAADDAAPQPHPPREDQGWSGPIILSADMAQSATLFMALVLLQRRIKSEGIPLEVACTVYRNTKVAPRLDGRNGFIFKVLTRESAALKRDAKWIQAMSTA